MSLKHNFLIQIRVVIDGDIGGYFIFNEDPSKCEFHHNGRIYNRITRIACAVPRFKAKNLQFEYKNVEEELFRLRNDMFKLYQSDATLRCSFTSHGVLTTLDPNLLTPCVKFEFGDVCKNRHNKILRILQRAEDERNMKRGRPELVKNPSRYLEYGRLFRDSSRVLDSYEPTESVSFFKPNPEIDHQDVYYPPPPPPIPTDHSQPELYPLPFHLNPQNSKVQQNLILDKRPRHWENLDDSQKYLFDLERLKYDDYDDGDEELKKARYDFDSDPYSGITFADNDSPRRMHSFNHL